MFRRTSTFFLAVLALCAVGGTCVARSHDPLLAIIKTEGGFTDCDDDRGGPTKYGITLATYSRYLGRPATIEELKHVTKPVAQDILREEYYVKPGIDQLPHPLAEQVLDAAVNMGQKTAIKMLQQALGLKEDGRIGPATLDKARQADPALVNNALAHLRMARYEQIALSDPSQVQFLQGWLSRARRFLM